MLWHKDMDNLCAVSIWNDNVQKYLYKNYDESESNVYKKLLQIKGNDRLWCEYVTIGCDARDEMVPKNKHQYTDYGSIYRNWTLSEKYRQWKQSDDYRQKLELFKSRYTCTGAGP
jgi:hypothetical protein